MEIISALLVFAIIIAFIFGPFILVCELCESKNRSKAKGVVVVLFTGWLGILLLWLGLKKRDPQTKALH